MNASDRDFFRELENSEPGDQIPFRELVEQLRFNDAGLVPVIAQDVETETVLMLAWMNASRWNKQSVPALATYWSRSRQNLIKGKRAVTTNQSSRSISIVMDMPRKVRQEGAAHATTCKHRFYLGLDVDETVTITPKRSLQVIA